MTEYLGVLSISFAADDGISEEKIKQIVKKEFEESNQPTNGLLNGMDAMLKSFPQRRKESLNSEPNTS